MIRAQRVGDRIGPEAPPVPLLVVRVLHELLHAHVDRVEVRRPELAVDDGAGRGPAPVAPVTGMGVDGVVRLVVVPDAAVDQVLGPGAHAPVVGVGVEEEVAEVVPERHHLLRVLEELGETDVELVEGRGAERRRHPARHDGLRVRVLAAEEHVGLADHPRHVQRLDVELPRERVHVDHDVADRPVAVPPGVGCRRARGALPQLGVGLPHDGLRVVGPRQQEEVERVVVEELGGQRQVADHHAERWRRDAEGHLDGHRRGHRVDATAHAAGAAGDEDGVARIAPEHDDLVTAKERGHRARLDDLAPLEVGHRVEGQRAGHAGHRVEVHAPDVPVAREQLLDLLARRRARRARLHLAGGPEGVRLARPEVRLAVGIELDGQVLEAHGTYALAPTFVASGTSTSLPLFTS